MSDWRSISFCLGLPPSDNRIHRVARGRIYVPVPIKKYRAGVRLLLHNQLRDWRTISEVAHVAVAVTWPDKRRRDLLNLCKVLNDSLTDAGVWADDSLIARYAIAEDRDGLAGVTVQVEGR